MPMVVRRSQVKKVNESEHFISNERHYQLSTYQQAQNTTFLFEKKMEVSTYEKKIDIPSMIHIILLENNPQNSNNHGIHHAAKSQHS